MIFNSHEPVVEELVTKQTVAEEPVAEREGAGEHLQRQGSVLYLQDLSDRPLLLRPVPPASTLLRLVLHGLHPRPPPDILGHRLLLRHNLLWWKTWSSKRLS